MSRLTQFLGRIKRVASFIGTVMAFPLLAAGNPIAAHAQSQSLSDGPCEWTGKYKDWVYQERQLITTYAVPVNIAEARRMVPAPFVLAEPARVRISVLDLYEMAVGATYKEAEISLLVRHKDELGWYIATLPVTDGEACGGGVASHGFPKIVRRVTLDRQDDRYVGIMFQHGGQRPEFTLQLTLNDAALTEEARKAMGVLSQLPSYTMKADVVYRFPGYPRPVDELSSPLQAVFDVRFGYPSVDIAAEPTSVLYRMGIVQPDYGFWMRMRQRYSLNPRKL